MNDPRKTLDTQYMNKLGQNLHVVECVFGYVAILCH